MKKKWLLLIVLPVIIIFTLLPLSFLNADPSGTSLVVTKDATGSSEGYLTWSIEKSVDKNSINLAVGQATTVNYTVTVAPTYHETGRAVNGDIHIQNAGSEAASVTYVNDMIEYKIGDGPWTALKTEVISGPFTIPASSSSDVSYDVSFTPVEGAMSYRNTALVGLANYSIPGGGTGFHEFSYTTGFSVSGGTVTADAFADVSDSLKGYLGETWVGDAGTYTYTYSWPIGPYATTGDYTIDNTATVTGTDTLTADTSSISIAVHVAIAKADALIDSGVPGKGLDTAPGQQKPHLIPNLRHLSMLA
ncbi:MAG: hypothetical protein M1308_04460 [Actinobacteria bacterium]|nr:hypothetical protein [Actinomycetota bacterium]MCL5070135.1 hypothetical protein [Actinomycetota bacterium]